MKRIALIVYFFFFITILYAQGEKNKITLSASLSHYSNIETEDFSPEEGYYSFPVNPGLEVLYSRTLMKRTEIILGLFYQYGRTSSYQYGSTPSIISDIYQLRFQFHEFSIPILFRRNIVLKQSHFFLTSGLYSGLLENINVEYPTKYDWEKWSDEYELEGYSDDNFYMDLYFDMGYIEPMAENDELAITAFLKYRINRTWMNHHHRQTHFGIKLSYSFKY